MQLSRRRFLSRGLGATAVCGLARLSVAKGDASADTIVDTHTYIGHWPHKRLIGDDLAELVATLKKNQITETWVGSFDGLFHKDIAGVNRRLAEACARIGDGRAKLIPFGTVNPMLPDWEEDVRRCDETFHVPGVRLHPNYQGYTLDDARFGRLLELAANRGLIVQLVASMKDERHMFLNPHVAEVNLKPLVECVKPLRELRLVVANGFRTAADNAIRALAAMKHVYFDFALAENALEVGRLVKTASPERVLFGSCAPLHGVESTVSRMHDAGMVVDERYVISVKNAERLIAAKGHR